MKLNNITLDRINYSESFGKSHCRNDEKTEGTKGKENKTSEPLYNPGLKDMMIPKRGQKGQDLNANTDNTYRMGYDGAVTKDVYEYLRHDIFPGIYLAANTDEKK